jgi:hypothetical protein
MKGMVLGQTCDKYLKMLAFFMAIMRSASEEWIEAHLTPFQYYNPYLALGVLGEDMFV